MIEYGKIGRDKDDDEKSSKQQQQKCRGGGGIRAVAVRAEEEVIEESIRSKRNKGKYEKKQKKAVVEQGKGATPLEETMQK